MENFRKEYFTFEESPYNKGIYMIAPKHDLLSLKSTSGSYNIICARLMNLSYAQYLRMCRDILGAEIRGKGSLYPVAFFEKNNTTHQFLKILNLRAATALHRRAFPDLEQKIIELKGINLKNKGE